MILKSWRILETLNEEKLYQLLLFIYPDLTRYSKDDMSPIDYYSKEINAHIELKCRSKHFPTFFIEKKKYDVLIQFDNPLYICSSPNGIYEFYVKYFPDLVWYERTMNDRTEFGTPTKIKKLVADLTIDNRWCNQIDHLLFSKL